MNHLSERPRPPAVELHFGPDAIQQPSRTRSQSAPTLMTAPTLRTRPQAAGRNGHPDSDDVENELRKLVDELIQAERGEAHSPWAGGNTPSGMAKTLDQLISETIDFEIRNATTAPRERQQLAALNAALGLLPADDPAHRYRSLMLIVHQLERASGRCTSTDVAARIVETFAAYPCATDPAQLSANALDFTLAMGAATAGYPFAARCEILVALTIAADHIDCFAMARAAVDGLINEVRTVSDDKRLAYILQLAARIEDLPEDYRPVSAMKLYGCVPTNRLDRLAALEAIAANNVTMPDSQAALVFRTILNQEIYRLRLDQT